MTRDKKNEPAQRQGSSVFERKRELAQKRARRRRRVIAAVCSLLVVAVVGAGALWYFNPFEESGGGRYHNPNADVGQLEGKTPEEIQAELNRVVEEGMFNISIAEVLSFPDGTSEGDVRIENVPNNNYLMDVTVKLDETGEEVYESGILEPNHHITKGTLKVDLDKGTYPATAVFTALDPETEAVVGEAAAEVTIMVAG
ncbi:hypothetical protein [Eggerthella timonensis]|uniref:hypothetical protein n=1 Tax=Eggerthella timonensis TaxID=1871008 RepID=UPI000C790882|nr:hypothetical protein [Eggerthella timonensis]